MSGRNIFGQPRPEPPQEDVADIKSRIERNVTDYRLLSVWSGRGALPVVNRGRYVWQHTIPAGPCRVEIMAGFIGDETDWVVLDVSEMPL